MESRNSMNERLRVGWDLDGVGYVFGSSVRNYLTSIGITVEEPTDEFCKHWNFFEFWKMTKQDFAKHCDAGTDLGYVFGPGDGLTRPNFFESMARVHDMGQTNVITTHRYQGTPGSAEANTLKWLEANQAQYDEIHFSADKTSVHTDMFVEDNRDN